MTQSEQSQTAVAARCYIERGWFPVPLPPRAKRPLIDGWQELRLTLADVPKYFSNGANLGINLGASDLADVDLDCAEVLTLAPAFLPATGLVFGRWSSPRSHWIYASQGFRHVTFKDPLRDKSDDERVMIVELRAGNHQTVFPPSRHPSGEFIEWAEDGDAAIVAPDELGARVARLAAAALLVRYWPPGARHEASLALAGGLLRSGWPEDATTHFIQAIARAAGDEEWEDRVRAVGDTAAARAAAKPTTGWPTLREIIEESIVATACAWLQIATPHAARPVANGMGETLPRRSQATAIVDLAEAAGITLFHTAEGRGYADLPINGHIETHPLRSAAGRLWLSRQFYQKTHTAPGSQALQDALNVLETTAQFAGVQCDVFIRLARHEGAVYLDLGNERWEAIQVDTTGWRMVSNPPVKFRRPKGMRPLPLPETGGNIVELWPFVNVHGEDNRELLAGFLVGTLRPEGPYPILLPSGEKGTAKSNLARIIHSLIDPFDAPLRAPPKNEHELMIDAANAWLLTYNNLSQIPPWLSDALCRLSEGGGLTKRELYSDAEQVIFKAARPLIITSIADIATKGDLLDRAIPLLLPPIADSARRSERALWAAFDAARPRILGSLLDAVACALRRLPQVNIADLPRLADFAEWVVAAEPGLGLAPGTFLTAYAGNRQDAVHLALEGDTIAAVLPAFMDKQSDQVWIGSATKLLKELAALVSEAEQKHESWPKRANNLSNRLRQLAPDLRRVGIDVQFPKSHKTGRRIIIRKSAPLSVPSVPSVPFTHNAGKSGDGDASGGDGDASEGDAVSPDLDATAGMGDAGDASVPNGSSGHVCARATTKQAPPVVQTQDSSIAIARRVFGEEAGEPYSEGHSPPPCPARAHLGGGSHGLSRKASNRIARRGGRYYQQNARPESARFASSGDTRRCPIRPTS